VSDRLQDGFATYFFLFFVTHDLFTGPEDTPLSVILPGRQHLIYYLSSFSLFCLESECASFAFFFFAPVRPTKKFFLFYTFAPFFSTNPHSYIFWMPFPFHRSPQVHHRDLHGSPFESSIVYSPESDPFAGEFEVTPVSSF